MVDENGKYLITPSDVWAEMWSCQKKYVNR